MKHKTLARVAGAMIILGSIVVAYSILAVELATSFVDDIGFILIFVGGGLAMVVGRANNIPLKQGAVTATALLTFISYLVLSYFNMTYMGTNRWVDEVYPELPSTTEGELLRGIASIGPATAPMKLWVIATTTPEELQPLVEADPDGIYTRAFTHAALGGEELSDAEYLLLASARRIAYVNSLTLTIAAVGSIIGLISLLKVLCTKRKEEEVTEV